MNEFTIWIWFYLIFILGTVALGLIIIGAFVRSSTAVKGGAGIFVAGGLIFILMMLVGLVIDTFSDL